MIITVTNPTVAGANLPLFAVPFDLGAIEVTSGRPLAVETGIRMSDGALTGAANYGFTNRGTLVYVPGEGGGSVETEQETAYPRISGVVNWFEELNALVGN